MKTIGIRLILIHIHEAHSDAWPIGLESQPKPHSCFEDRIQRAHEFVTSDDPPYDVYIDGWDDAFEQQFRAWPDKYYFINNEFILLETSSYGSKADALIDYDCIELLENALK